MHQKKQLAQYIFTVSEFLTADECDDLIQVTESIGYTDAPVNSPVGPPTISKNIRNNDRVMFDDPERADALWQRAKPLCPEFYKGYSVVGLNERFRFYRYDRGHVFRWHADGSFRRENGEASRLTFMVYLNDDFDGGETLFEDVTIEPERGMALVFAHGYLHEGGEVFAGRKYVLRTDVMYSGEPYDISD
jgi:predicted 2-oxoglutarate/Fe(II)-dependent dioxygenase YbiX